MKNFTINQDTQATQSDPALLNEFVKLLARSAAAHDFKAQRHVKERSMPDD